jgi:integrase
MAGITFVLREPTAKTSQPINCIIRIGKSDRAKFSTGFAVIPKNWDKEKCRVKNVVAERNKAMINSRLNDIEEEFDKLTTQHSQTNTALSKEFVKLHFEEFLKPKQPTTAEIPLVTPKEEFFNMLNQYITDSENGKRKNHDGENLAVRSIQRYKTIQTKLIEFSKITDREMSLQNIDDTFYLDFVGWLQVSKGFSKNNIGKYITTIKSIMNYAVGKGFIEKVSYETSKFKATSEESDNVYLTISELEKMYALDLSQNLRLERVRDLFIVGAFTGFRYSDLNNINRQDIKTDEDGYQFIEIVQEKTGNPVTVPVLPLVKEIFEKYGYVLPSITNQKMNDYIKEVCQMAEIKETVTKRITKGGIPVKNYLEKWELVTTHTARRSFCTNAYKKGVDTLSIMAVSGHFTEKSFMKYIKLDNREKSKRFRIAWLSSTAEENPKGKIISLTA